MIFLQQGSKKRVRDLLHRNLIHHPARKSFLPEVLSPRDIEIIKQVAAGLRNMEIGKKLFISEGTVKIHLHNIYQKLGVDSRTKLARYAQEKGLV